MTTLSVPINEELSKFIREQIKSGKSANKSHLVRSALLLLKEDIEIKELMESHAEVKKGHLLHGDLDELASKI